MKKIKKLLAMLMAMTMVLGMSVTVFAAELDPVPAPATTTKTATITVTNLQKGVEEQNATTKVDFYRMIAWNEAGGWTVENWASGLVTQDETTKAWTINETAFAALKGSVPENASTCKVGDTQYVAKDATTVNMTVAPGTYMIKATDPSNEVKYALMVANTFDEESSTVNENRTVVAKGEEFGITKTITNDAGEDLGQKNFVGIGDEVKFKVVTYFPYFDPEKTQNLSYTIIDTPTGMTLANKASVQIGTGTVDNNVTVTGPVEGKYTIDLTGKIDKDSDEKITNADAGQPVTITYTGTVTGESGYTNKVAAYKNGETDPITPDPDDPPVKGFTGDISIKKVEEGSTGEWAALTGLAGAEFTVAKAGTSDESLKFTEISSGVYKLALKDAEGEYVTGAVSNVKVDNNGVVKVMGLGEGTYKFVEVVAPAGYSVESTPVPVTITPARDAANLAHVSMTDKKADTKLASLPSTGGIGTTIFYVVGGILVAAAGILLVTKRRMKAR